MIMTNRPPKFSDLLVIFQHPIGLLIGLIILGLIFIYRGVIKCLSLIVYRLPLNLTTPKNILADGICDHDKMFQVKLGEFILNLIKNPIILIVVIILSLIIYYFFNRKSK